MRYFNEFNRKIVVNADDFGCTKEITAAILECFEKGLISQTTLLVNMPYAQETVKLSKERHIDSYVGLHLNFTDGMPLTEPIKAHKNICDDAGCFRRHMVGVHEWTLGKKLAKAIEVEARAQIERYLAYDLPLRHCDGHHHVHGRIGFAKIVLPLLKEYGFVSVRNRYTLFPRYKFFNFLPVYLKAIRANRVFNDLVNKYGLISTLGFGGWNGEPLAKWSKYESFELMVHPRYDEDGTNVNVVDFKRNMGPAMSYLRRLINEITNKKETSK